MAMERVWRVFKEEAKLGKLVYDGALKLLVLLHGVDCVYPLLCLFPVFEWLLPDGMFFFCVRFRLDAMALLFSSLLFHLSCV
jgi:hypothetical protein